MKFAYTALVLLLLSSLSFAQLETEGGNVTELNLTGALNSTYWDGLYGDVVLGAALNYSYVVTGNDVVEINMVAQDPNCTIQTILMHVIAVNDTSLTTPLSVGNLAILDAFIPSSGENGSATFTNLSNFVLTYGTFNNVPTTYTYANNASSLDFREGYLNDASGNLVFITEVVTNRPDWEGGTSDYQIILPNNGTPVNYTLWVDVNYTCQNVTPGPGPGPGHHNEHRLYIYPPGVYEAGVGGTFDFSALVENRGDFVERDIDVYIQNCPSGFTCGSGFIGRLGVGDQETSTFPLTVKGVGEYVLTVCAENIDVVYCEDFIVRIVAECSSDSDCVEGEYCDDGICQPKKKPKEKCERDGECESNLCRNDVCVLCESNSDCASNEICYSGVCEKIVCDCGYISNHACIEYECCSDSDCASDEFCIDHSCIEKELDILVIEGEFIEGEEILVQVVNNKGEAIPFARVFTDYMSVIADANGFAAIGVPYNGLLYANKDGYPQAGLLLDVVKLGFFVAEDTVYAGIETRMQVVDSQGLPIAGAEVFVNGHTYITDENGYFRHTFDAPGKRTLSGKKPGYLIQPSEINVLAAEEALCGFPIIFNLIWFDSANIYILWILSIIVALFNLALSFRRFLDKQMLKALKSAAYALIPLLLALPGISIFTICFMSNIIVLQAIIEIALAVKEMASDKKIKKKK